MDNTVHYLETGSLSPFYNLAFEEYVLTHRTEGSYLLLWQNDNTIVVGQNQNTEAEINRAFVERNQIHVVRRSTGGGAVYHDLGNLNYSFITDLGNAEELTMERFTKPVVNALRGLGLDAEASGRNDILVSGRKVSGTAQRVVHGRILHHGTLLFDANPSMVAGALQVNPAKFRSKSAKSVQSRIGNIRDFLEKDMSLSDFWAYLKTFLSGGGLLEDTLSPQELTAVEELKRSKYASWDWNFGCSPKFNMHNIRFYKGGCLEIYVCVEHGKITEITFYGDFLSTCSLDTLTAALRDCPFSPEAVSAVLDQYRLSDFFGGIEKNEVLDTLFHPSEESTPTR